MASSDNLASIDPWTFRPTFADSWFPEALALDAEALTKALQKSLSSANSDTVSPFTTPTSTVSGLSGSDHETLPKRQRSSTPSATGKVSKRKSRASKRSQTTFITADPANFRQMVQQVTGVRFDHSQMPMAPILKPEPQRPGSRLLAGGGGALLPTLDTSALLLDHHQQEMLGSTSAAGPGSLPFAPPVGMVDAGLTTPPLDFGTFPSFPTLESWKVM